MTARSWSDEQLSAYLDGELSAPEMDALSQDVERDSQLAARLERVGSANAAYIDAVSQVDRSPMAETLKVAIERPPTGKVISLRTRRFITYVIEHRAIAASLLCAAAVWGLMATASKQAPTDPFAPGADGVIIASSVLHDVLENAATGQARTIGGTTAIPRLTFVRDDGSYCRQFDVATAADVSSAIACREADGWRTQVAAYGLSKPTGEFQTASAARSPALESFLDNRMSGAPMNIEEEKRLLADGWTKAPR